MNYLLRIFFLFVVILCANTGYAQGHEDVFPDKSGNELLILLRQNYKPSTVLDYYHARLKMYTEIYNEKDTVYGIYTRYGLHLSPNDPDPIGTLIRNGSDYGINTEHTFPQSKGARQGNARSDMHHLFPAMARVNSARSNYPFGDIDDKQTNWWYYKDKAMKGIPSTHIDEYSEGVNGRFEPREDKKGDIARAMFYFMTIYRSQADASFFSGQRKTLCAWHIQDPVDSLEWARNIMKAKYQSGKKNPFILDCTLARRTYCPEFEYDCAVGTKNVLEEKTEVSIAPVPARVNQAVRIAVYAPKATGIRILSYNSLGKGEALYHEAKLSKVHRLSLPFAHEGMYLLHIQLTDAQGKIVASFIKKLRVE